MLAEAIGALFERYGRIVGLHPLPFLLLPILLTAVLSVGLLRLQLQDDVRFLYSAKNGPSIYEYHLQQQFTGVGNQSTYCALAVEAATESGSRNLLLTRQRAKLINQLNRYVMHNLTFMIEGQHYHFGQDICPKISYCPQSNRNVERFINAYFDAQQDNSGQLAPPTYPVMDYFGAKFFLPTHLYGVQTEPTSGRVTAVEMVRLIYLIPSTARHPADTVAVAFESALTQHLSVAEKLFGLDISMFSLRVLKREIGRNAARTIPYVSVTVVLLVAFTVGSCLTADWLTSKPIEGLLGVTSSGMATVSAAGLMGLCGVPFVTQVSVMPFITLAIGVDDTYIILGAWQRTDRRQPVHVRLGHALCEAGSAITLTSLTDCMSFAIGAFSATPAISIFCQYMAAAIAFDFLYQTTFFAAVVAFGGVRERLGYHSVIFWRRMAADETEKIYSSSYQYPVDLFFRRHYARWICKPPVRAATFVVYVIYLCLAIYGCSLLKPSITPGRLVVDDSPAMHYLDLAEHQIWSGSLVGRVYVNRAPDFVLRPNETDRMLQFFRDLEQSVFALGANSSQIWLTEFLTKYYRYFVTEPGDFYHHLQVFLSFNVNKHWHQYVSWKQRPNDGEMIVNRFFFTTGFRINELADRTHMLLSWREVCSRYPDYQAFVYDEQNFYTDQVLELPVTTQQALGIALCAMTVVCILFINDHAIGFWVVFSLLSMDVGITGFLSLWDPELSPTTVVCILMSIGLSVDSATHVAYKMHWTQIQDPDERIAEALGSIAWPVCQGGISTVLAIVVFLIVPSHVVRVFARTCILVVVFGLFHGLLLLPVILRTFSWKTQLQPARTLAVQKDREVAQR